MRKIALIAIVLLFIACGGGGSTTTNENETSNSNNTPNSNSSTTEVATENNDSTLDENNTQESTSEESNTTTNESSSEDKNSSTSNTVSMNVETTNDVDNETSEVNNSVSDKEISSSDENSAEGESIEEPVNEEHNITENNVTNITNDSNETSHNSMEMNSSSLDNNSSSIENNSTINNDANTTAENNTTSTQNTEENNISSESTEENSSIPSVEKLEITDIVLSSRSGNCEDYVKQYEANVMDIQNSKSFEGLLDIEVVNGKCKFLSNAIPNHDFNDQTARFSVDVSAQNLVFEVSITPTVHDTVTDLTASYNNGVMLNGVTLDMISAGCYGVGNGRIGCNDPNQPFRYDPMSTAPGASNFGTDAHNAHTQSHGEYHYHGTPLALYDLSGEVESPVIGFAADGFPIFGPYINENGTIRKVTSSYQLKTGMREAIRHNGVNYDPGGEYDGLYRDDYTYQVGSGDLDECNGMTKDGVYGYYVSDTFPWIVGCFKGTPDVSFKK